MGKYDRLRPLFEDAKEESLTLRFEDLEDALGQPLPDSARKYIAWWAPSQRNSVWADYGFLASPDLRAETASFTKVHADAQKATSPTSVSKTQKVVIPDITWDDYELWNKAIHDVLLQVVQQARLSGP